MQYHELKPSAALQRYVECFWFLSSSKDSASEGAQRILPDGCMEILLNLADPFCRHEPSGYKQAQSLQLVAGQLDRPIFIEPTGRVDLVGIRFHPAGAYPFFRFPMAELKGCVTNFDLVVDKPMRELAEHVAGAQTRKQRCREIEIILTRELKKNENNDFAIKAAVDYMVTMHGRVSIDSLSRRLGLGCRQLERMFKQWVGIEPKLLGRILRFQKVFRSTGEEKPNGWAAIALQCGFYDQSHLIKEFKQFAGQTPPSFFAATQGLAHFFTRKDRVSDFSKTIC